MSYCGFDCEKGCPVFSDCGGCEKTCGHPMGGDCIAAETVKAGGTDAFNKLKAQLIEEINALGIPELKVTDLNCLMGFFVNLEYELPNGTKTKLLKDNEVYLGNQLERENSDRCYGVVSNAKFILVCEYGKEGIDPEILLYKKR